MMSKLYKCQSLVTRNFTGIVLRRVTQTRFNSEAECGRRNMQFKVSPLYLSNTPAGGRGNGKHNDTLFKLTALVKIRSLANSWVIQFNLEQTIQRAGK